MLDSTVDFPVLVPRPRPHRHGRALPAAIGSLLALLVSGGVAAAATPEIATRTSSAEAQPAIAGPGVLNAGEVATYRVRLAGDPAADSCNAVVALDIPAGFRVRRSYPAASSSNPRTGRLEFAPLDRLARGDEVIYEVELEAPAQARTATLCARLDYSSCQGNKNAKTREFAVGPACTTLTVLRPAAVPTPPQRSRSLGNLRIIPCGTRPTVTVGGSTFDPNEWTDSAGQALGTTPSATLQAKTNGTDLFLLFRTQDLSSTGGDEVEALFNVNNDVGPPTGLDRAFAVTRAGAGTIYSGASDFSTVLGPFVQFEIAELGSEWVVEMQIPLADLSGPTDPTQMVGIAAEVRDGGVTASWPVSFLRPDQATMSASEITYCQPATCTFSTWAQAPDSLDPLSFTRLSGMYDEIDGPNGTYAGGSFVGGSWTRSTAFSNGGSTGNVLKVEAMVRFYVDAGVANDSLDVEIYYNGTLIASNNISNGQLNTYLNNPQTYIWDVTGARAWLTSDFDLSSDLDIRVVPSRNGSWDGVGIEIDAVGFRVRTDGTCVPPSLAGGVNTFIVKDDGFASILAGQNLTYQLQFGNQGIASATKVIIVDQIPANTTYRRGATAILCPIESTCGIEYSANGIVWTPVEPADNAYPVWIRYSISLLTPGGPITYPASYQVQVDPFALDGTRIENEAVISQLQTEADSSDNNDWDDNLNSGDDLGDEVGPFVFPSITIPCVFVKPVIDGVIDRAVEYANANVLTTFRTGGASPETVNVYVQHDLTDVFVAFDVDDDQWNNRDACYVVIDPDTTKGDPDLEDRQYNIDRGPQFKVLSGIGNNTDRQFWTNFSGSTALGMRSERLNGWQAEYRIPISDFAPRISGQGDIVGIAFLNFSTSCGSCWANSPAFALLDNAWTWTNAYLEPCTAEPNFQCTTVCAGQQVDCTDQSGNNPVSWAWDFDDGTPVDNRQHPDHVYAVGGVYDVELTVCNARGCASKTVPVTAWGVPVAQLSADASTCLTPSASITLDATGSTPGAGATLANPGGYAFTSTLGTVSGGLTPIETLSATLPVTGTARVTLTVIDSNSCQASVQKDVFLAAPPVPVVTPIPAALCGYLASDQVVQLDASGTGFPTGATATNWGWIVPTGTLSGTGSVVDWTIPGGTVPGLYSADLTVTDSASCSDSASSGVRLWRPPAVRVVATPVSQCSDASVPMSIALTATGTAGDGSISSNDFLWTATAGTVLAPTSANTTLDVPAGFVGTIDVCATLSDDNSCSDLACTQVTVHPRPVPDFTIQMPLSCTDDSTPIQVQLDAVPTAPLASIPDPTGFSWLVTSGVGVLSASDGRNPILSISPGFSGPVTVTLTTTDVNGCPATVARSFVIKPGPQPQFDPAPFERCTETVAANVIDLDALGSTPTNNIDSAGFVWSNIPTVGSFSPASGPRTRLTLPPGFSGTVTVTLTLTDRDGCARDFARDYLFHPPPVAALVVDRTSACRDAVASSPFILDASTSTSAAGIDAATGYQWWSSAGTLSSSTGPIAQLTPAPGWFGVIDVRLTITDQKGCTSETTEQLVVHAGPSVSASVLPQRLCSPAGQTSDFALDASASSAPDGIDEIVWLSVLPQAQITTGAPGIAALRMPSGWTGTVPLSVRVTDNAGCSASVAASAVVDPRPVASFTATAEACDRDGLGARFALDASASSLPSGPAAAGAYVWSASAGILSINSGNPALATLIAPPSYQGVITVGLILDDARGCSDRLERTVEVMAGPVAQLVLPVAELCSPAADTPVVVDASGSGISDPAAYSWSATPASIGFSVANGAINQVIVPAGFSGVIDVTVSVIDALGCTAQMTRSLTVNALPVPDIAAAIPACAAPGPIVIALDGGGSTPIGTIPDPSGYSWQASVGTLNATDGRTPTLTLPASFPGGPVDVTLEVRDGSGCVATRVVTLDVKRAPVAVLTAPVLAACQDSAGTGFDLDASGSSGASALNWSFSTAIAGAVFIPLTPGRVRVTLPGSFTGTATVNVEVVDGSGCKSIASLDLRVQSPPAAALSAVVQPGCKTPMVQLDASASVAVEPAASIVSITFAGNGGAIVRTLSATTAVLDYPAGSSGTFSATATVTDSNGCVATRTVSFTLVPPPVPVPDLKISLASACSPVQPVVILDASGSTANAPATVSDWRFSATGPVAVTSSGSTGTLTYAPGTTGGFQASVEIEDSLGCIARVSRNFYIPSGAPPAARLTASATEACLVPGSGIDVTLDASTSDPGTVTWWSSPGTIIVGAGRVVILRLLPGASGLLQARVTVTAANGCAADAAVEIVAREMPKVVAAAVPERACEGPSGTTFLLSSAGSESRHPLDPTLTWTWSSSDGTVTGANAPTASLLAPRTNTSHDVAATLVVSDIGGCTSLPAAVTMHLEPSPQASFAVTPAPAGRVSSFTAIASSGGTPAYQFAWQFGDGATGVGLAPTHTYAVPGTYTVTLLVTDQAGCSSPASQSVVIAAEGALAASFNAATVCEGNDTAFTATVSGGTAPYQLTWTFGDGAVVTGAALNVMHRYPAAGSYSATLSVSDASGRSASVTATVQVAAVPVLTVTTSGPGLLGIPQTFSAAASVPVAGYSWLFSDGVVATGANVVRTFTVPGSVTASVSAIAVTTVAPGCRGESSLSLVIEGGDVQVSFTKSVSPAVSTPGAEVGYELVILNGDATLSKVVIEDVLPAGFEYRPGSLLSDSTGVSLVSTSPLRIALADIPAGARVSIRYRARIDVAIVPGSYDNGASLTARDPRDREVFFGPRIATVRVDGFPEEVVEPVDLRVRKRADPDPEPPAPGGLVHYRIDYENVGSVTATGVVLRDDWPFDRGTIVDNGDGGLVLGSRIEWDLGSVSGGASGSVQYTIRLNSDLANGTPVRNSVVVESEQVDAYPQDNRDAVDLAIGGLPDLSLTKSVATTPDPAVAGATARYTLIWRNTGAAAPQARITDDYDESRIELVALPAGGSDAGGVVTFELGQVASGASGTIVYEARLREGAAGAVENRADISSALTDANPGDNSAQARFDVVTSAATLTLSGGISTTRRCHQPQVEVALRGEQFDTAGAMRAAAEFVRAASTLGGSAAATDPLLATTLLPALRSRLLTFAGLNVESLLFDSGMGLPWAAGQRPARTAEVLKAEPTHTEGVPDLPAPIVIPFVSGHPVFALQRGIDEPWCRHDAHRATTPEAIGETLAAVAEWAAHERISSEPGRRVRARLLLAQAADAVQLLTSWRMQGIAGVPGPLPARILLAPAVAGAAGAAGAGAALEPAIADSRSLASQHAALATGLFALARVASEGGGDAASAGLAGAARTLGAIVLEDLAACLGGSPALLLEDGSVLATTLAKSAAALEAARTSGGAGIRIPAMLAPGIAATLDRLAAADGSGFAAGLEVATGVRAPATLESEIAGMQTALILGQRAVADATWRRLEMGAKETRLHIYRTGGQGGAISYTPELLGSVIGALTRLVPGASPADRALLVERLSMTLEKVALEAGLQTALTGRTQDDPGLKVILGADGDVKVSSVVAGSPKLLAPVMVDRVSFLAQGVHHRDRSRVDAARGIREEGSAVSYLAGMTGDCRTAEARLVDRRFATETGLLGIEAMASAGQALAAQDARKRNPLLAQFGRELRTTSASDAATLAMLSGLGVPLRFAPGVGSAAAERELLTGYATAAGLESVPAPLLVSWLPLDGGDPVFPEKLDASMPYAQGWERSRFAPGLSAAALGRALLADVRAAGEIVAGENAWLRFVGLVRLHAASLKVELMDRETAAVGGFPGLSPVLDAEGRPVNLNRAAGNSTLRGDSAMLQALVAYRDLVTRLDLSGLPVSARPPLKLAPAQTAIARLTTAVTARLGSRGAGSSSDVLSVSAAVKALLSASQGEREGSATRALAAQTAASVRSAAAGEASPLAHAALALEAEALALADPSVVAAGYKALRDGHYDRTWKLFRSGVAATPERDGAGEAFLLTDLDVASVLSALSAALPVLGRSEAEEAADLLYTAGGRMLFETGLQRDHRLEFASPGGSGASVVGRASQIASAVRLTIADTPVPAGTSYPGDLLSGQFTATNPTDGSVADDATVRIETGPGLRYVSGSTRINGKLAADPAAGDTLAFSLGRLGGSQSAELTFLLRVSDETKPGNYQPVARGIAKSMPGAGGTPLETAPVAGTIAVGGFGSLEGRVYLDLDQDGVAGSADPGVADVTVVLDDGTSTVSDAAGTYRFSSLVPAGYRVKLLEGSLPGPMSTVGAGEARVRVLPLARAGADFGLAAAEKVTGIVFRDENGDRRMGADEPPVAGVVVETDSGHNSISDRSGRYLIRGVTTGSHQLRIARRQPWVNDSTQLSLRPLALPTVGGDAATGVRSGARSGH